MQIKDHRQTVYSKILQCDYVSLLISKIVHLHLFIEINLLLGGAKPPPKIPARSGGSRKSY